MSLSVMVVPVTAYQQNCSIVKDEATGKIAVVDPGDIQQSETHGYLVRLTACAGPGTRQVACGRGRLGMRPKGSSKKADSKKRSRNDRHD